MFLWDLVLKVLQLSEKNARWRQKKMDWKRKKSSEIVKTQCQISKDFCGLFQMYSCMCYLPNLCPNLEHDSPVIWITVSVNTPFVWTVKHYSILCAYVFEGGSCKWQIYVCSVDFIFLWIYQALCNSRCLCNKWKSANLQRPMKEKVLMGIRKCNWRVFSSNLSDSGQKVNPSQKNVQGSCTKQKNNSFTEKGKKESNKWKQCLTIL